MSSSTFLCVQLQLLCQFLLFWFRPVSKSIRHDKHHPVVVTGIKQLATDICTDRKESAVDNAKTNTL